MVNREGKILLALWVTKEFNATIKRVAEQQKRPKSKIIREVLEKAFTEVIVDKKVEGEQVVAGEQSQSNTPTIQ